MVTESGIVISVSFLHLLKAYSPISTTDSGILTLLKLLHPQNELAPIIVTVPGITISSNPVQSLNRLITTCVVPSSNRTVFKLSQFANAPSVENPYVHTLVKLLGISISVKELHLANAKFHISVNDFDNFTVARLPQLSNAHHLICVTESGIIISVNSLQPLKAYSSISVTDVGISTVLRLLQS